METDTTLTNRVIARLEFHKNGNESYTIRSIRFSNSQKIKISTLTFAAGRLEIKRSGSNDIYASLDASVPNRPATMCYEGLISSDGRRLNGVDLLGDPWGWITPCSRTKLYDSDFTHPESPHLTSDLQCVEHCWQPDLILGCGWGPFMCEYHYLWTH